MRKLVISLIAAVSSFLWFTPAQASTTESITEFKVMVVIEANGEARFTEDIRYDFAGNQRHGLLRLVPLLDHLPDSKVRYYDITKIGVLADGAPAQFDTVEDGDFLGIRVGDPNITISGIHTYEITYTITNGLNVGAGDSKDQIEFYWDLIGDGWNVPISSISTQIVLPGEPSATNCTFGNAGSTEKCVAESETNPLIYTLYSGLEPHQSMTLSTQMSRSLFTSIATPDIQDQPEDWPTGFQRGLPIGGTVAGIIFLLVIAIGITRRRNLVTAKTLEVIRFEPPTDVKPAEMMAAVEGKFDAQSLVATLLDLAVRGHLQVRTEDKDLVVKRSASSNQLTEWEQELLTTIFRMGDEYTFAKYDSHMAATSKDLGANLTNSAINTGRRNKSLNKAKIPYLILAVLSTLLTIVSFVLTLENGYLTSLISLPLSGLVIGAIISAILTPQIQTESSAEFISSVNGFKKALDTDSAALRREFANKSGLETAHVFATMLPFAVALGLDKAWLAQFPDLDAKQLQQFGWYYTSIPSMHTSISDSVHAMAQSITPPSSSGDGSGGGSSGGGGGGGGGGSW